MKKIEMAETVTRGTKRGFIEISSSSDCSDEEEFSSSTSSEDDDESEWNESDDQECSSDDNINNNEDGADDLDEESLCRKVSQRFREPNDLQDLNLKECKAYLRRCGLRLSGTKAECIGRIKEHWRLKDGNGEALYPKSSFTIDCTGDVCTGDVVLFTQKVYNNFDKRSRRGSILGKRTIAGRIVKESYGAAKQQHTFTVEVLWSKGMKALPPLIPLLVKGRNLYRLKTFRQLWKNEEERSRVLVEKHARGAVARSVRSMRKTEGTKRTKTKASRNKGGTSLKKRRNESRQGQLVQATNLGKENCVGEKSSEMKKSSYSYPQKPIPFKKGVSASHQHQRFIQPNYSRESSFWSYPYPPPDFYHAPSENFPFRVHNRFIQQNYRRESSSHSYPYPPPDFYHAQSKNQFIRGPNRFEQPNYCRESSTQPYCYPPPEFHHAQSKKHSLRAPNFFPAHNQSATSVYSSCENYNSTQFGMHAKQQELDHASYQHDDPSNFSFKDKSRYVNHFPNR